MAEKLAGEARDAALAELTAAGWATDAARDAIVKTYRFRNFVDAFAWMTAAAIWAEKLDHHPEWSNVYRTVEVLLTTHSANGLTELDLKLARRMDALAASQP